MGKAGIPEALTRGLKRPDPSLRQGDPGWFQPYYEISADEVDEAVKWREEIVKLSQSAATLSNDEAALAFAIRRIEAYKAEYDRIKESLKGRKKEWAEQRKVDRMKLPAVKLQLEEALRDAGEIDEAMKYAIDGKRKAKLRAAKKAIEQDDLADCGHPDFVLDDNGTEVAFPHLQVVKRVFSKRHFEQARREYERTGLLDEKKRFPYLIKCTYKNCTFRNVTPYLPTQLAAERAIRERHSQRALANDATLRVHDREVLRRV